ncbi:MAG: 4Fe-4S dicluster domain-containing protein [Halanaerobiales bacterium]
MSIKVDENICTGCPGHKQPPCVKNCPGDLLFIDRKTNKLKIRNPEDCWDCMVCVKVCPVSALETKLPYQLAFSNASLKVYKEDKKIIWKLNDKYGNVETFNLCIKKDQ